MLFNSLSFAIFFPLVVACYFLCPARRRWALLLTASYVFYACWKIEYVVLIAVGTLINYWVGIQLGRARSQLRRRLLLGASVTATLGILVAFKYWNFFQENAQWLIDRLEFPLEIPALEVLLPVGISFYTFQLLAYVIDVYRGQSPPERHLGYFALYVSFFPQLVAGPIERADNLLPQFKTPQVFDDRRVAAGLRLMLWGFFKKLVIADRLALYVNEVYGAPEEFGAVATLLATYFFAIQIYCDFSGYSDIAIGAARVMGISLMENFRFPYTARSVGEFWRRWHISLSTWFRDYLYIPLGGNRVRRVRWHFNIFLVFVVSGFWHGAQWTFLIWGAIHGGVLLIEASTHDLRENLWRRLGSRARQLARPVLQWTLTFHIVLLAWVFFRADSLQDAATVLGQMTSFGSGTSAVDVLGQRELERCLIAVVALELIQWGMRRWRSLEAIGQQPTWQRWAFDYAAVVAILSAGVFGSEDFIYFQF